MRIHLLKRNRCGWSSRWKIVLLVVVSLIQLSTSVTPPSQGLVLRVRLADGSLRRVVLPKGSEETTTIRDILEPFALDKENTVVNIGQSTTLNATATSTIGSLGLKNGSIISISSSTAVQKALESQQQQQKIASEQSLVERRRQKSQQQIWNPFPDLAKDYDSAVLKTKTRRTSNRGMSYGDIANIQSSMHIVEPQPEGPLKRVYMCQTSAERFQTSGLPKPKKKSKAPTTRDTGSPGEVLSKVGLLLGTIQTELVEKSFRKKPRTSLSSQTSDAEYCTVAKVQAIWEPPNQKTTKVYNAHTAKQMHSYDPRVLVLAKRLGLVPIGWMYSYTDNRREQDDELPVHGLDIEVGASLQISKMQKHDDVEDKNFVTLAMNAKTGETEAFQLSDLCVQMVHEDIFAVEHGVSTTKRQVPTKYPILVDGRETHELDSVLCLINTAILPHIGTFAGKSTGTVKKSGSLSNKTKKLLLSVLDDDRKLWKELSDFNVLLALDRALSDEECALLCSQVKRWNRGQKQGTKLDVGLKRRLYAILGT